ncbi:hypothetical protein BH18ACT4_BH18ACT4_07560 [soil metagenome]
MTTPPDLDSLLRRPTVAAGRHREALTVDGPEMNGPPGAELPAGTTLHDGRFVVRRVLGRGGFGITYATDDRRLQRGVAVKELFPDPVVRHGLSVLAPAHAAAGFAEAKARFLREATVLARFSHPGIVRVYEVFEEHGTAYLVMELLDGRPLTDMLSERSAPLTEAEALDVAARGARALAVVHAAGILHRDLNPSNVMVTADGRVVLIDFGLAREFAADVTGAMTRLVTPGYAPPEQYLGAGRFGPSTDVYGLAATLYWMLVGIAPVSALDRQVGTPLPAPHRLNRAVSPRVSAAVLDGLELHADHRPRSMPDFLARLGLADEVVPARPLLLSRPAPVTGTSDGSPHGHTGRVGAALGRTDVAPPLALPPTPPPPRRMPGWWTAALPGLVALAALGSAAPVLVVSFLVLVALPAVATAGDAVVFTRLRRQDGRLRLLHRVALPAFLTGRFVRNLSAVALSAVPALLVGGLTVAVTLLLDGFGVGADGRDVVLRPGAAATALLVALPVFRDRRRFRAAVIGEMAARRLVDGNGRLTSAGMVAWLVAALTAAVGFGFRPDLWPLA